VKSELFRKSRGERKNTHGKEGKLSVAHDGRKEFGGRNVRRSRWDSKRSDWQSAGDLYYEVEQKKGTLTGGCKGRVYRRRVLDPTSPRKTDYLSGQRETPRKTRGETSDLQKEKKELPFKK